MLAHARRLAWLATAAWLFGCDQSSGVDVSNTLESVLPATESSKDFGDYIVYFNALRTDQLTPEVARDYSIVRSKSRALLNVSIHRKEDAGRTVAVTGAVAASAINLTGQLKRGRSARSPRRRDLRRRAGRHRRRSSDLYGRRHAEQRSSRFTVRFKQFFVGSRRPRPPHAARPSLAARDCESDQVQ
jgi:hypothetical protein